MGTKGAQDVPFKTLKFVFASTMPDQPHEYVKRTAENEAEYVELFEAIQMLAVPGQHRGRTYRYYYADDGYKYWTLTTSLTGRYNWLINRTLIDDPELLVRQRVRRGNPQD